MRGLGFIKVLSNRGFLFLWLGQLLSQLADRIFIYVLVIIAYSVTHLNLGVSIPMLAFGIPSVLFGSLAGVFVDRIDRKGVMLISNILRGLMILFIVPLVGRSLLLIFLISFLIYTVAQFFAPAETSSIPELVEKENLILANSFFMLTWMGTSVVGFGLGAPLVTFLGEKATLSLAAGLYLLAALAVALVPLIFRERKGLKGTLAAVWKDFLFGLEFVRRNIIVRYSLIKMFVATSALAVVSMLAIAFAETILKIEARHFGYLVISVGLGMFIGMGLLRFLGLYFKKGTIVITGFILSGIMLLLLTGTNNFWIALVIAFFLGVGVILVNTSIQTILQQKVPRQIRGRVFGVQNMLINSAFTLPILLFGAIADFWGLSLAFLSLGILVLVTGGLGIFIPKFRTV